MARRVDNECAYCAREFEEDQGIIGTDMKVYCSTECTEKGEQLSAAETARIYHNPTPIAA